jgi:hypothetical protein
MLIKEKQELLMQKDSSQHDSIALKKFLEITKALDEFTNYFFSNKE